MTTPTLNRLRKACADEREAVELLEQLRWADDPRCPHCGSSNVYQMLNAQGTDRNKNHLWRCRSCKDQYTVRIGTGFQDTRIPLRHWCFAMWMLTSSKKGFSAKQFQRMTGLSYKSALSCLRRLRVAMIADPNNRLSGVIEADEAYIGGRPRNRHATNKRGRGTKKTPVLAVVARGGHVRSRVLPNITTQTLRHAVNDVVESSTRVITDEYIGYRDIHLDHEHEQVMHKSKQYVTATGAHTNTVESYFSTLKRGITGIYHAVSKEHLPTYLYEFDFRYNTKDIDDTERFVKLAELVMS